MKKLLTIAAVVLAAVCVQAATTSWEWNLAGLYGVDDVDTGDEGFVTGSVELINAAAGGTLTADFDADGNAMGTATGDTTGAFAADTPWQAKVTVNIGGQDYTQTFDFTMPAGLTGDAAQDAAIFAGLNGDLQNMVQPDGALLTSVMSDPASGWTAVPEPCSVALLALGLAALGLKRKVA